MRKRCKQIVVMLSEKEHEKLVNDISIAKISKAEYIRSLLIDRKIKASPPKEYAQLVYEVSKIGNNINQLAHNANATNHLSVIDAKKAVLLMEKCWDIVRNLR
jgi:hypothetical protein